MRTRDISNIVIALSSDNECVRVEAANQLARNTAGNKKKEQQSLRHCARLLESTHDTAKRYDIIYAIMQLNMSTATDMLVAVMCNMQECARVRGQATEALGRVYQLADRRQKAYKEVAVAVNQQLRDPSPEVRFWACYALGVMRFTSAISELERLVRNDKGVCKGWWSVRREANNALTCIRTGSWPED